MVFCHSASLAAVSSVLCIHVSWCREPGVGSNRSLGDRADLSVPAVGERGRDSSTTAQKSAGPRGMAGTRGAPDVTSYTFLNPPLGGTIWAAKHGPCRRWQSIHEFRNGKRQ